MQTIQGTTRTSQDMYCFNFLLLTRDLHNKLLRDSDYTIDDIDEENDEDEDDRETSATSQTPKSGGKGRGKI
eukprot:1511665-Amphidinium_carterae.1